MLKTQMEECKCCDGRGVQHNKITGMNEECPCCRGSGKKSKRSDPSDIHKMWVKTRFDKGD